MKLAAGLLSFLLAAAAADSFRYSRSVASAPGWARLELPDDVLDACRPGLPDLRIVDPSSREVPYAIERRPSDAWRSFPALNLESVENEETVFVVDRGARPGIADAVTIDVTGADFLKPVRVQTSSDRADWKDVARGSIFAAGDVRMLTLPLPDTDRRYLRFRLDDRNGPALRPGGAIVHGRSSDDGNTAEKALPLGPRESGAAGGSAYPATLPAAHLALTALRFQASDPAFSRPIRVYERVFFRDEVHRRLVAEGMLVRSPGETGPIDLPVDGIAGRNLEIEIDDGDSPALSGLEARALVRPTALRFFAPAAGDLKLLYGSASVRAPSYDLARAIAGRPGTRFSPASVGEAAAAERPAPALAAPPRVALADPESWPVRLPIELPARGTVAYLDFAELRSPAEIRIVDSQNRQVPFIVEQGAHEHVRDLRLEDESSGTTTRVRIDSPRAAPPIETPRDASPIETSYDASLIDAIELRATGPDYFSREVRIEEEERDARGVTGTRTLGRAGWTRRAGEPAPTLRIPISRPHDPSHRLFAVIENGDNAPITLAMTEARAFTSTVRFDFVFEPGEKLSLLTGHPGPRTPAYDLALVASAVLAAPAEAAKLGRPPAPAAPAPAKSRPAWFWAAVAGAVLLLLFQLGRVLRTNP